MSKTLSLVLWTTPYTFQNTSTAIKITRAALGMGYILLKKINRPEVGWTSLSEVLKQTLQGKRSDLVMRGFQKEDAIAGTLPSGYEGLVDLMMEKYNSTIGAF